MHDFTNKEFQFADVSECYTQGIPIFLHFYFKISKKFEIQALVRVNVEKTLTPTCKLIHESPLN